MIGSRPATSSAPSRRAPALDGMSPMDVARSLQHLDGLVFFDSAGNLASGQHNAVSLIAARPVAIHRGSIHAAHDVARLEGMIEAAGGGAAIDQGIPAGGLCGWVEYEGDFVFGDYPEMLVFRHADSTWWESGNLSESLREPGPGNAVAISDLRARRDREWFLNGVRRIREWIAAGDIYQVNLTQSFDATVHGGSLIGLYEVLREVSPSPMAAWLSLDGREVLSSSPETFLRFSGRAVETRPIKGTRPRFPDPDEDTRSAYELRTSAKEIAELVMITDLLRNDLGQVCDFGSVEVTEMLSLESLGQVHHLVSSVHGRLRENLGQVAAMASCFPGGSITGAPKKRAMEIIRELENESRGLYCGAIGWFGYHGESAFNIAIRTMIRTGNHLQCQVGAGIVADSHPAMEYEETLHKATGMMLAIRHFNGS
ncbi:MAG: anthranilate synthase component I family protein [Luteolibacter sp.]